MAGTPRLRALRLGFVQESREQKREGGWSGRRKGTLLGPSEMSPWGHFEHRSGSFLLLHTGRTKVEGPVRGAVVTQGRDEMGPEQHGSCGGEGRGSTQESRVRITARMARGGGNLRRGQFFIFCPFIFLCLLFPYPETGHDEP